jgi:hypothetical protein
MQPKSRPLAPARQLRPLAHEPDDASVMRPLECQFGEQGRTRGHISHLMSYRRQGLKDETAPSELRGIGVRLEGDVLVTPYGHDVLTGEVPIRAEEVEAAARS